MKILSKKTRKIYDSEIKSEVEELIKDIQFPERERTIFCLMMMGGPELSPIPLKPKGEWEYPSNDSMKCDYCESRMNAAKIEPALTAVVTKITAVITDIGHYRTATQKAESHIPGAVAERKGYEITVDEGMADILHEMQKAANAMTSVDAVAFFQRIGTKIWSRVSSETGELEVSHGKISGSLDFRVHPLKSHFAVLWMISTDKVKWDLADFSHNGSGHIEGLTKNTVYYIKAKTSSPDGKSDWTQIVEITCL